MKQPTQAAFAGLPIALETSVQNAETAVEDDDDDAEEVDENEVLDDAVESEVRPSVGGLQVPSETSSRATSDES